MERFKTLSEKLINFYSHRFLIAEERLSWAVVYISEEGETSIASVLNIKDSDYYINIQYDMIMKKVPEDHDLILFNMIDAWFSETDKNLRYGVMSGHIKSIDLDMSRYINLHSFDIPLNYDIEYIPEDSIKGTKEQIHTLDFYSYKCQIDKNLLRWGVFEFIEKTHRGYYPIIRVKHHRNIALDLGQNCTLANEDDRRFWCYNEYYFHDTELIGDLFQFTDSFGKQASCTLNPDFTSYTSLKY